MLNTELIPWNDAVPVDKIPYIDHPELRLNKHESTEMPFRYVRGEDGGPVMPEVSMYTSLSLMFAVLMHFVQGMFELIKKDADKGLDDLL